ncbi:replication protein [Candidatus Dojkabacteria bacterium]|nr:replication protein [Candidatus Dojkabacteria bacterium]
MQTVGEILKETKYKEFTKPNYEEILKLTFLRFPLFLYELEILEPSITKRQIKILKIIARYSIGCKKATAYLNHSDFQKLGFYPSDITKELKKLVSKNYIGWDRDKEEMWISRNLLSESPTDSPDFDSEILSKNLVKHSRNSKYFTNQNDKKATATKGESDSYRYKQINIDSSYRYQEPNVDKLKREVKP